MEKSEVINRLKARLGGCSMCIELKEDCGEGSVDHWSEIIQQALDLLNTRYFLSSTESIKEDTSLQKVIDYSNDDKLLTIYKVDFLYPRDVSSSELYDPFRLVGRTLVSGAELRLYPQLGNVWELLHHRGVVHRAYSTEPDWFWESMERKLYLYMPGGPYDVMIFKAYPYSLETLPPAFSHLFLKICEGYARLLLAHIRGKYGDSIPGPTGTISVDASRQQEWGQRLIDEAMQQMKTTVIPIYG